MLSLPTEAWYTFLKHAWGTRRPPVRFRSQKFDTRSAQFGSQLVQRVPLPSQKFSTSTVRTNTNEAVPRLIHIHQH